MCSTTMSRSRISTRVWLLLVVCAFSCLPGVFSRPCDEEPTFGCSSEVSDTDYKNCVLNSVLSITCANYYDSQCYYAADFNDEMLADYGYYCYSSWDMEHCGLTTTECTDYVLDMEMQACDSPDVCQGANVFQCKNAPWFPGYQCECTHWSWGGINCDINLNATFAQREAGTGNFDFASSSSGGDNTVFIIVGAAIPVLLIILVVWFIRKRQGDRRNGMNSTSSAQSQPVRYGQAVPKPVHLQPQQHIGAQPVQQQQYAPPQQQQYAPQQQYAQQQQYGAPPPGDFAAPPAYEDASAHDPAPPVFKPDY